MGYLSVCLSVSLFPWVLLSRRNVVTYVLKECATDGYVTVCMKI